MDELYILSQLKYHIQKLEEKISKKEDNSKNKTGVKPELSTRFLNRMRTIY
jgi:hypothetical protein